MDWQALQDGLKSLVAAASGLAEHNLAWDGEPEVMRGYPMAMLELKQPRRDGTSDETRYEANELGQLIPYIVGNRAMEFVITVKSREQRADSKAYALLDQLRTRLELPSALRAFDELGVALRDSPAIVDLSAVSQAREESVGQLSMTLGYVVEERDAQSPEEPIEHVQVSGEVALGADADAIVIPEQTIP